MKHGDKAKANPAKAKAAGQKSGTPASKKSGKKAGESSKAAAAKAQKGGGSAKEAGKKTSSSTPQSSQTGQTGKASDSKGKAKVSVVVLGEPGFTNPVVAEAFKRAVKKYPTAFRRLTD